MTDQIKSERPIPASAPGQAGPAGRASDAIDSNRLAYTGRAVPAPVQAARARSRGVWYCTEATLRSMRGYGYPILIEALLQPLLYLLSLGVGLNALIHTPVSGVGYLEFVAPALLVSTVVMAASGELTYPVLGGFKWQRTYFGALATPVTPAQIALGHLLGVTFRFAAQALAFWIVLAAFGASRSPWSWLLVPIGTLSAVAFGALLQAYSASILDEGAQFAFVQRFVVMPMFLFAGTFFPLEAMPGYLQWIGWVSPIWHGTQLARMASFGMPNPGWLTAVHLAFLVACVVAGCLLSVRVYRRRLGAG